MTTVTHRDPGLRRALTLSAAGTVGARVTGAFGGLLAARLLGPAGRGQLAVLVVIGTAGATGAAAGIHFWIAREVALRGSARPVARVLALHTLAIIACVPVLGLLFAPLITELTDVGAPAVAACIALAIAGAVAFIVLAIPHGFRSMGTVALATTLGGTTYAAVTGILLVTRTRSVTLAVAGAVAGQLVVAGVALAFASARLRAGDDTVASLGYRSALGFSIPAGAGEVVLLAMLRVDILLVAAFLPIREAGLYAVAIALSEVLWVIPDGIALVALPTSASDVAPSTRKTLVGRAVIVTAACGLVLSITAEPIIRTVFGTSFAGAASAVPLLAVAAVAGGAWKVIGAEVVAAGRTLPRFWSAAAGLVGMVLIDVVAIPELGLPGAALGAASGYVLAALVLLRSRQPDGRAAAGALADGS